MLQACASRGLSCSCIGIACCDCFSMLHETCEVTTTGLSCFSLASTLALHCLAIDALRSSCLSALTFTIDALRSSCLSALTFAVILNGRLDCLITFGRLVLLRGESIPSDSVRTVRISCVTLGESIPLLLWVETATFSDTRLVLQHCNCNGEIGLGESIPLLQWLEATACSGTRPGLHDCNCNGAIGLGTSSLLVRFVPFWVATCVSLCRSAGAGGAATLLEIHRLCRTVCDDSGGECETRPPTVRRALKGCAERVCEGRPFVERGANSRTSNAGNEFDRLNLPVGNSTLVAFSLVFLRTGDVSPGASPSIVSFSSRVSWHAVDMHGDRSCDSHVATALLTERSRESGLGAAAICAAIRCAAVCVCGDRTLEPDAFEGLNRSSPWPSSTPGFCDCVTPTPSFSFDGLLVR